MIKLATSILAAVAMWAGMSLFSVSVANAAPGNFECDFDDQKDGAYMCFLTSVTPSVIHPRRPWLKRVEATVGGDRSTLEGGACNTENKAASILHMQIRDGAGRVRYQRKGSVCKASGYSRTFIIDPPIRVRCNSWHLFVDGVMHDNFGSDKYYAHRMRIETC